MCGLGGRQNDLAVNGKKLYIEILGATLLGIAHGIAAELIDLSCTVQQATGIGGGCGHSVGAVHTVGNLPNIGICGGTQVCAGLVCQVACTALNGPAAVYLCQLDHIGTHILGRNLAVNHGDLSGIGLLGEGVGHGIVGLSHLGGDDILAAGHLTGGGLFGLGGPGGLCRRLGLCGRLRRLGAGCKPITDPEADGLPCNIGVGTGVASPIGLFCLVHAQIASNRLGILCRQIAVYQVPYTLGSTYTDTVVAGGDIEVLVPGGDVVAALCGNNVPEELSAHAVGIQGVTLYSSGIGQGLLTAALPYIGQDIGHAILGHGDGYGVLGGDVLEGYRLPECCSALCEAHCRYHRQYHSKDQQPGKDFFALFHVCSSYL